MYTFQADLHAVVGNTIPQLLQLLTDKDSHVRVASAKVIVKLFEHSEFRATLEVKHYLYTFQAELHAVFWNAILQLLQLPMDKGSMATLNDQLISLVSD
jgi:hypothetical protein